MANPIGWATRTWNPVTGCTPISEGCAKCYAKRMATRLRGRAGYPKDDPFRVTFHRERLEQPFHWQKPQYVFVGSMTDMFHEDVQDDWLRRTWQAMGMCPKHIFMVLTKRPGRMRDWLKQFDPLPNVWLGVTAENQARFNERWPVLRAIPAAVRFVSAEPLLGLIATPPDFRDRIRNTWLITGPETGPGAREGNIIHAMSLRDQCHEAGVPFWGKGPWSSLGQERPR